MKKYIASEFDSSMPTLLEGYSFCRSDFAGKFAELQQNGLLRENGPAEMIWQTRSKFVLKVPAGDGKFVVYKSYRKISKPYKYMLRLSPCGLEALNYQLMQNCQLPMARLLAVGEERKFFKLRNAFIVTEFADGFRDGRDFTSRGELRERPDLAEEFILRNLAMLAHCHDCGILHRGFTPANLLYKLRDSADASGHWLDIVWIDVASCRQQSLWRINQNAVVDFVQFFRFFDFNEDELQKYIQHYCLARQKHRPAVDKLLKKVLKKLANLTKN